jgi:hypothetical protein
MPKQFDEKIIAHHKYVIRLRKNNRYLLSQKDNTDQIPLYFDKSINMTTERNREKRV